MYVCICKGITDRQVRAAIDGGADSVEALGAELGVGITCGGCVEFTHELLADCLTEQNMDNSLFYSAA